MDEMRTMSDVINVAAMSLITDVVQVSDGEKSDFFYIAGIVNLANDLKSKFGGSHEERD